MAQVTIYINGREYGIACGDGAIRPVDAVRIEGGSSDHYPLMATFDTDIK